MKKRKYIGLSTKYIIIENTQMTLSKKRPPQILSLADAEALKKLRRKKKIKAYKERKLVSFCICFFNGKNNYSYSVAHRNAIILNFSLFLLLT